MSFPASKPYSVQTTKNALENYFSATPQVTPIILGAGYSGNPGVKGQVDAVSGCAYDLTANEPNGWSKVVYVLRRIAKTQPGKEWEVAALLAKICAAYEAAGRNKAQIYIEGRGLPGSPGSVYAEWTQDVIAPNWPSKIPASVGPDNAKLQELLSEYRMEIFELATPEKLQERGLA